MSREEMITTGRLRQTDRRHDACRRDIVTITSTPRERNGGGATGSRNDSPRQRRLGHGLLSSAQADNGCEAERDICASQASVVTLPGPSVDEIDGIATNPDAHIFQCLSDLRHLQPTQLVDLTKDICMSTPRSEITADVPTEPGAELEPGCEPTELLSPRTEPPSEA